MQRLIDPVCFRRGHRAFLAYMQKKGRTPFTGFDHPFLVDDEIQYKWTVRSQGQNLLNVSRWKSWRSEQGRILGATRAACQPAISRNLLEHRFGPAGNSDSPLYRVESNKAIRGLEEALYEFLCGGPLQPEDVGPRFDEFAGYLRLNKLGCKWPFLAYLLFLMRPETFFPIRPGRFAQLLQFYGVDAPMSGRVEWSRYTTILDVADQLKDLLAVYGTPSAIEVQSYMWVVAYLVAEDLTTDGVDALDYGAELAARQRKAEARERTGFLGEQLVYEAEQARLSAAGRPDLVRSVRWVAVTGGAGGYDIRSYTIDGAKRCIEVKSTTGTALLERGFWLAESERACGEVDPSWTLVRVYAVDTVPNIVELGNVVVSPPAGWTLQKTGWFLGPQRD